MERTSISFAENLADLPQALNRIDDFQDGLRDLDLEAEIGRHHVGQPAGVFEVFDHDHHVRDQDFAEAHDPFDLFFDGPHDGFGFEGGAAGLSFDQFVDPDGIIGIGLNVFLRSCAFASPCTRILMRSSGSFSIRMMMPTVPTAWMSSGAGFSTSKAFCVARKIMRLPANAASIALIDMSRPTNSGSTI